MKKKTLSKKSDPRRRWASFRRHANLMGFSLFASLLLVLAWYALWSHHIRFEESDESIVVGVIIASLIIAFSVSATKLLDALYEKTAMLSKCVLLRDKRTFMTLRDERLPITMNLFQATLSVLLISMVMLIGYRDAYAGAASVFVISLIVVMYFVTAMTMQDPTKSPWFAERIPADWLTEDVDQYFHIGEQRQ